MQENNFIQNYTIELEKKLFFGSARSGVVRRGLAKFLDFKLRFVWRCFQIYPLGKFCCRVSWGDPFFFKGLTTPAVQEGRWPSVADILFFQNNYFRAKIYRLPFDSSKARGMKLLNMEGGVLANNLL